MTFPPDGYIGTVEALGIVIEAAWPDERQRIYAAWREAYPENYGHHIADHQVPPPPDIDRPLTDLLIRAERRLRNLLHQGRVEAVYSGLRGKEAVPAEYWATTAADGTLLTSEYAPFGPVERSGFVPAGRIVRLLIDRAGLDRALIPPAREKPPLPRAELPKIVERLRELEELNRDEQRAVIAAEWPDHHIRDKDFRAAFEQVPRKPGPQGAKRGGKSGA